MRAAGCRLTQRSVTGGALPAVLTATASVHTPSVSAAVCRLTAPRVDAQDGGDGPSTAPPTVRYTEEEEEERSTRQAGPRQRKISYSKRKNRLTSGQTGSWTTSRRSHRWKSRRRPG